MSKPKLQPLKSEPTPPNRVPSVPIPATARKASSPSINTQSAGAAPRFYTGPTVSTAGDVKAKAKAAASKTAAVTKASTQKAVAKAKRHPWSILSILTTIPFLVIFSLASTVLCPAPGPPSALNRYVLSPLGYEPHSSHPVLCYPANVYHREILQPYVYPILDDAQHRAFNSPAYVKYVEPATTQVKSVAGKAWNGPVRPVVDRTVRGARRFYLTFIQPHIPYVRAKIHGLTAPYTSRISAFAAPHVASANAYANSASDNAVKGYKYAAAHPLTGMASDYAQRAYKVGSERSYQAYQWSKPHAIRARLEVERITREVLGPRAVNGLQTAAVQATKIEAAVRAKLVQLYHAHLEPHVGPYVDKTALALAPYTALFHRHVHQPYIQPTVNHFFPVTDKPKSFLSILSDFLPSGSSHAAERKGQMDDFYNDIDHARRPADVKIPEADKVAEKKTTPPLAEAASKEEKRERKEQRGLERIEMERVREAIKSRVDEQGKQGLKTVKSEMKQIHADFTNEQLPILTQNLRSEIEREIEYITRGLDKLYTSSTSLTKDQVAKSVEQADGRLKKTQDKIKARLESVKTRVHEDGRQIVKKQFDALDQATGKEYKELAEQMAWIDDISVKDWDKYNQVKKLADSWKEKYIAIHEDPSLTKPFSELKTELNDYHEVFRERVGILKRTAVDRIQAREAISAEPSRVSILPIKEAVGAAAGLGAGAVIGKGKDQILDALSQAQAAVQGQGSATASGVYDQAKASAESLLNAASSGAHDATRSISLAVGATPTPESPREHVESAIHVASEGLESFVDAATVNVHDATRSAMKAVGVTPTPESIPEHAESAYNAAVEAIESLSQAAESVVHDATRSAIKAMGGTPSPESPAEHAQSVYDAAAEGAGSLASSASEALHQATRSAVSAVGATPSPETFGESVESVLAAASESVVGVVPNIDIGSAVHDATRAAVRADGATPSPETPGEHLESLSYIGSQSASSALSAAGEAVPNLANDASSVLREATRSASSAVGATPSPESAEEYLESIANVVAGGAASVYGVVGDNAASAYDAAASQVHDGTRSALKAVGATPSPETPSEYAESLADAASSKIHEATRSAMKAVGVTPSPETPVEYAESVYDAASSSVSSVGSVVSDQIGSLATQIQEYLGIVPTPEPLASTASAYLASIASVGSSAGSEALESGSSILASLQTQAGSNIHQATRAISRGVGATPTPETPSEYLEAAGEYAKGAGEYVKEKVVRNPRDIAESLVKKHASQIARDLEAERAAGTTRKIQFGHDHKSDQGVGGNDAHPKTKEAHVHPGQDEL